MAENLMCLKGVNKTQNEQDLLASGFKDRARKAKNQKLTSYPAMAAWR